MPDGEYTGRLCRRWLVIVETYCPYGNDQPLGFVNVNDGGEWMRRAGGERVIDRGYREGVGVGGVERRNRKGAISIRHPDTHRPQRRRGGGVCGGDRHRFSLTPTPPQTPLILRGPYYNGARWHR
ncbi:hypothetical protein CoHVHLJ_121 [Columbid alphaherpesvirus 1]|uniref:Uncharacterized protein n=1 Tax=Columbid alphaherpesvirus 1 TaxID=93386 RepID=A0A1V0M8L4_9ALPH|nr:hypothetical protein CoHVHLJ_095 [Columbid alphaherpesvirus 1]YP_009353015.1 hypothetical protein CoHVHLJ_121 [Columbid alphaherpesvirus 1]ARD71406.1 hypothetical protein CoHVHLJ_095 [Columbid alphaherpesvirus 1]ARD71432.1 hypothetical protein CoHVHLJ_121 [Columbid alphaherpesvirus 1]